MRRHTAACCAVALCLLLYRRASHAAPCTCTIAVPLDPMRVATQWVPHPSCCACCACCAWHGELCSFTCTTAVSLDLWKVATQYMLGRACIAECIAWDGGRKKTRVHLIPRPGGAAAGGAGEGRGRGRGAGGGGCEVRHATACALTVPTAAELPCF